MSESMTVQSVAMHEQQIVNNLYPLFIHDNWAYSDTLPNAFGIIGSSKRVDGGEARSLAEQSEILEPYWALKPGYEPLLIRVHGRPAGFCLLQHAPAAPEGHDHYIDEFFVLHPYRRSGIGRAVVRSCGQCVAHGRAVGALI